MPIPGSICGVFWNKAVDTINYVAGKECLDDDWRTRPKSKLNNLMRDEFSRLRMRNTSDSENKLYSEIKPPAEPKGMDAFDKMIGIKMQDTCHELVKYRRLFSWAENPLFGVKKAGFVLLSGPPGCGKTEIAKSCAEAFGVPLWVVEPGHIHGHDSGDTASRLQKLAQQIKDKISVVVLFDEVDNLISIDNDDAVRSQFRQLVDGPTDYFADCNVLFIGTTNQLDRIQKDVVSRAEVIHMPHQTQEDRANHIGHLDNHLAEDQRYVLAKMSAQRHLSGRDHVKCKETAYLHFEPSEFEESGMIIRGRANKELMQQYENCFASKGQVTEWGFM